MSDNEQVGMVTGSGAENGDVAGAGQGASGGTDASGGDGGNTTGTYPAGQPDLSGGTSDGDGASDASDS
jgi:hypothetical protein